MELGTCLFCGINSSIIVLVMYVPLSLKISKDVVCRCLLYCTYLPVLINKDRHCHLLG